MTDSPNEFPGTKFRRASSGSAQNVGTPPYRRGEPSRTICVNGSPIEFGVGRRTELGVAATLSRPHPPRACPYWPRRKPGPFYDPAAAGQSVGADEMARRGAVAERCRRRRPAAAKLLKNRRDGDGYLLFGADRVPFAEAQPSPDGAFWPCNRAVGSRRRFFAPAT